MPRALLRVRAVPLAVTPAFAGSKERGPPVRPRLTGLWLQADFVRLWAGTTISYFGTMVGQLAMQFTAIFWLGAGPAEVAILSACALVPAFVCGTAAGVWVDRLRRRPILVLADVGRGLALA